MSRWFPHVDTQEGIQQASKGGMIWALVFAAMIVLGMVITIFVGRYPGTQLTATGFVLLGQLIELVIVLITAWRFKIGKGLIWGAVTLLIFAIELIGKVETGTTRIGWIIFYAAVATGLVNGIRGAWARRSLPLAADVAGVFE